MQELKYNRCRLQIFMLETASVQIKLPSVLATIHVANTLLIFYYTFYYIFYFFMFTVRQE